ncbi:hypothetical protein [Massilia aerilata]|uniref:Poly A polymerase head domain-containing protein n=1 Tax=Massilia aerilata TaxID=453817 RepID=A0ABW0S2D5_9BURK
MEIIASVHTLARQLGYNYLLVGATARDILMSHVFGIEPRRATHDVDHEAGNHDRLYDDAYALLEQCEFDLTMAGAALLGYDAGVSLDQEFREYLFTVLTDPRKRDRIVVHMTRSAGADAETATALLNEFERGLNMKKL